MFKVLWRITGGSPCHSELLAILVLSGLRAATRAKIFTLIYNATMTTWTYSSTSLYFRRSESCLEKHRPTAEGNSLNCLNQFNPSKYKTCAAPSGGRGESELIPATEYPVAYIVTRTYRCRTLMSPSPAGTCLLLGLPVLKDIAFFILYLCS